MYLSNNMKTDLCYTFKWCSCEQIFHAFLTRQIITRQKPTVFLLRIVKRKPEYLEFHPLVVSFSVRLSAQTSFATNTVIKYDRVITNIGDAYSTPDGKFTAPYNGTYQVSIIRCLGGLRPRIWWVCTWKLGQRHNPC